MIYGVFSMFSDTAPEPPRKAKLKKSEYAGIWIVSRLLKNSF